MDLDKGLKNCLDDRDFYLEILLSFLEDNSLAALDKLYAEKDWANYRMKVHSLKSSAAYIGAYSFSAAAKKMEAAIKENNIRYVEKQHEHFLLFLQEILEQAAAAADA